ncbi:hypothetical protein E8E12_001870 [Didymella heteroderae]|uniref:Xylanolytic transcriptional activator regulatory domain-containing protein n=1 Tax=Didymella heteroderae TaxID=1769908 RepID=A0A9P4WWC0_9PLEO|nr:hypothetical protein E8E12_001870 [Didymella heteroderae]
MAGLAFINPKNAYVSQGAFCTLPIRPFWYRLAFTWVPRYIIVLTIMGLAIAIYTHVGIEFRAYSNADTSFQSFKTSNGSNNTHNNTSDETKLEDITFELTNMESRPQPTRRKSSIGHDIFTYRHHSSSAPVLSPSSRALQRVSFESGITSHSLPGSALNLPHRADTTRPALLAIPSGQSITTPISPHELPSHLETSDSYAPEPTATPVSSSTRTPSPSSPSQVRLVKQRQRIHRQLRLIFIYPLVYTFMWLIPFAMHCMNYWDKYATNPIEFLRVGSSICITLMGFANALIFSLREKPWRGIDGSDGSFWGSFVWTRRAEGDEENRDGQCGQGSDGGRGRGSQSYRTSASGDFARVAAEQARQRLDLEREERLKALHKRSGRDLGGDGEVGHSSALPVAAQQLKPSIALTNSPHSCGVRRAKTSVWKVSPLRAIAKQACGHVINAGRVRFVVTKGDLVRAQDPDLAAALTSLSQIVSTQNVYPGELEVPSTGRGTKSNHKYGVPPAEVVSQVLRETEEMYDTVIGLFYPVRPYKEIVDLCKDLYFNINDIPVANLIVAFGSLYFVFRTYQFGFAKDDPRMEEFHGYSAMFIRNMMDLIGLLPVLMAPTVDNFEALLLGAYYAVDASKPSLCSALISKASHLCLTLGYHRADSMVKDSPETRGRKINLFWFLYSMDKGLCLRLGRASCIQDYDIAVPMPVLGNDENFSAGNGLVRFWCKLAGIQGRIYEDLYSPRALKQPKASRAAKADVLVTDIRQMWAEHDQIGTIPVIFCHIIETQSTSDLAMLGDFLQTLQPARGTSSAIEKMFLVCDVFHRVAKLFIGAAARDPSFSNPTTPDQPTQTQLRKELDPFMTRMGINNAYDAGFNSTNFDPYATSTQPNASFDMNAFAPGGNMGEWFSEDQLITTLLGNDFNFMDPNAAPMMNNGGQFM